MNNELLSKWLHDNKDIRLQEVIDEYTCNLPGFNSNQKPDVLNKKTCNLAALKGDLEILKILRNQNPPCPWETWECMGEAARGGHIDVMEWIYIQDPSWKSYGCAGREAAIGGHIDVLEWICSKTYEPFWDEHTFTYAVMGGHIKVLEWLRKRDPPCPWSDAIAITAAIYGNVKVLQWLRIQKPSCSWNKQRLLDIIILKAYCNVESIDYNTIVEWLNDNLTEMDIW